MNLANLQASFKRVLIKGVYCKLTARTCRRYSKGAWVSAEEGEAQYTLVAKSSGVSHVAAEVAALVFRSGDGVTPARLVRIFQAAARAIHAAFAGALSDASTSFSDAASLGIPVISSLGMGPRACDCQLGKGACMHV